jgi:hypothetical protein
MSTEKLDKMKEMLEANLPVAIAPVVDKVTKDIDEDYEFSRKTYKDLVNNSNEAIKTMLELASSCENPRAYEVLSMMLKNTAEMTQKLMDLQKDRKEIKKEPNTGPKTTPALTQNNLFVGTTADLQKQLIDQLTEKNVTETAVIVDGS